jgi:sulfide:quinone oxidoreductase
MGGDLPDRGGQANGSRPDPRAPLPVLIAGGGVAALELALALEDLAAAHAEVTVLAPNDEFVYRPYAVREPFAYAPARRYPLERIVRDAGASLLADELAWVDPDAQEVHTAAGATIPYGALAIAVGAHPRPRFAHALTIDDHRLDELMHGLVQDVEEGSVSRLAFLVPARMAWPLPIYELALMLATRAFDMNVELQLTIVTPEDTPLAIFGGRASEEVERLLRQAGIATLTSAYAEVCEPGEVAIDPGDRRLKVERIVALPELYGPAVRGVPAASHGFVRVDRFGQVPDVGPIYAAGDAVDFAVKHGGISSQQADVAARSIAALAGADVEVRQFKPVLKGMLLTGGRPLYLSARITGGQGFASEVTDAPMWSPAGKVVSKYLGPYLEALDAQPAASR